ncbi:hypothetical protein ACH5RR_023360 [Cinchona calisaya]|uniref:Uncharacterized protein n=1 Tax=Cinchona calisaya TaxID=153742 RepID=A0ABD2ZBJ5_9GENT
MNKRKKIVAGSLMKAVVRLESGELTPTDGDQVIYHGTVPTLNGVAIKSTRREFVKVFLAMFELNSKGAMLMRNYAQAEVYLEKLCSSGAIPRWSYAQL